MSKKWRATLALGALVVVWFGGFYAVLIFIVSPLLIWSWVWAEKKFAFKYGRGKKCNCPNPAACALIGYCKRFLECI